MRLIIANVVSADPVVPVRWCFGLQELAQLQNHRGNARENARVVISVVYDNQTEDRLVLPASEIMTFVSFRRPGTHTIVASLVYADADAKKQLEKKVNAVRYYDIILNESLTGHNFYTSVGVSYIVQAASISITVPADHFPKPPKAWVERLANMGFNFPSNDQCQLRRRSMGIPFKVLGLGFWAVITTIIRIFVVVVAVTSLSPGVNLYPIWHPWRFDVSDVTGEMPNTWPFPNGLLQADGKGEHYLSWKLLLHPWIYMFTFSVMSVIKLAGHVGYLKQLAKIWHGMLLMVHHWDNLAIMVVSIAIIIVTFRCLSSVEWRRYLQAKHNAKALRKVQEVRGLLTCSVDLKADSSTIPSRARSFRLVYLNLKRKVCRPFAS